MTQAQQLISEILGGNRHKTGAGAPGWAIGWGGLLEFSEMRLI